MYYLRTKAAADAIKFTVDTSAAAEAPKEILGNEDALILTRKAEMACSLDNPDACESCSG